MIIIKTKEEIARLRKGGPIAARILRAVAKRAVRGVSTKELDRYAKELVLKCGATPAFLGYQPAGARKPFPATLCVSVNDEVVHGIPGSKVLGEGDIVSLDLGIVYQKVFLDHAVSLCVGKCTSADQKLIATAREALDAGVAAACPGARVGAIGHAVERVVSRAKLGIVRTFSGHGVGRAIHEDPYVPNYGMPHEGPLLKPGMVLAIEPMITRGKEKVFVAPDGYTVKTADKSRAAHFEHTVLITARGPIVLTK